MMNAVPTPSPKDLLLIKPGKKAKKKKKKPISRTVR